MVLSSHHDVAHDGNKFAEEDAARAHSAAEGSGWRRRRRQKGEYSGGVEEGGNIAMIFPLQPYTHA